MTWPSPSTSSFGVAVYPSREAAATMSPMRADSCIPLFMPSMVIWKIQKLASSLPGVHSMRNINVNTRSRAKPFVPFSMYDSGILADLNSMTSTARKARNHNEFFTRKSPMIYSSIVPSFVRGSSPWNTES